MNSTPIIKPTHDDVIAVKAKTDNLPSDPAPESGGNIEAIKAKTDNLTADPASIAAITAIKQKTTGPAWNQDTDSLEAISEAISGVGVTTTTGIIKEKSSAASPSYMAFNMSGNANTWSGWQEVVASLGSDIFLCGFMFMLDISYTTRMCFEIGKGAAGSEVTIVRVSAQMLKMLTGETLRNPWTYNIPIPIKVTSGTRLSCRASKSNAGADAARATIQWYENL